MSHSIFKLKINEVGFISSYSSAPSMWLIIFVDHAYVIVFTKQSLDLDTFDLFEDDMFCLVREEIILKLSIKIVNNYSSFFFECFCRSFINLRTLIEFSLHFSKHFLFRLTSFILFLRLILKGIYNLSLHIIIL